MKKRRRDNKHVQSREEENITGGQYEVEWGDILIK